MLHVNPETWVRTQTFTPGVPWFPTLSPPPPPPTPAPGLGTVYYAAPTVRPRYAYQDSHAPYMGGGGAGGPGTYHRSPDFHLSRRRISITKDESMAAARGEVVKVRRGPQQQQQSTGHIDHSEVIDAQQTSVDLEPQQTSVAVEPPAQVVSYMDPQPVPVEIVDSTNSTSPEPTPEVSESDNITFKKKRNRNNNKKRNAKK